MYLLFGGEKVPTHKYQDVSVGSTEVYWVSTLSLRSVIRDRLGLGSEDNIKWTGGVFGHQTGVFLRTQRGLYAMTTHEVRKYDRPERRTFQKVEESHLRRFIHDSRWWKSHCRKEGLSLQ